MIFFYCSTVLLSVGLVSSLTCSQIQRVNFPSAEELAQVSPFKFTYAISKNFDCAQETFTNPEFGVTSYTGNALVTRGNNVTAFQYTLSQNNTVVNASVCGTSATVTYYPIAYQSNAKGSYYCAVICIDDQIAELVCAANSNNFAAEQANVIQGLANVNKSGSIHDTRANCSAGQGCSFFV